MFEAPRRVAPVCILGALVLACPPPAAAAEDELPWCAYDDPASYREARAAGAARCPQPEPGLSLPETLYLPLPCGHWLTFRKVRIPIDTLLADPRKTFGYAMPARDELEAHRATLFGPHEARVSGGFSEDAQGRPVVRYEELRYRSYYIGRYETSRLQFALLADGLFDRPEAADPAHPLCREAVERRRETRGSVEPAAGVDVFAVIRFVEAANRWLYAVDRDRTRRGLLPWLPWEMGSPGFLRLPSEAEWELAAWGGPDFAPEGPPTQRLHMVLENGRPVDVGEDTKRVAVVASAGRRTGVRGIGTRSPNPLGLFDMVGNAEELVWDLFAPIRPDRSFAGQRGGLVARGGAFDTPEEELAVGRRIEVPLFDSNGPGRTPSLGFRLVVSAPFLNFAGSWNEPGKYNTELLAALAKAPAKLGARTGSQEQDQAARIEKQVAELSKQLEAVQRSKEELSAEFARKLERVGAEVEQLRLRLAEAERARIAERVKSGIMLTKAVREFGGVALTIVRGIERVAEDLKRQPPEARSELRRRLETLCRDLTDRERQADVQYELLFGWVDDLARSEEATVGRAFEKVGAEFRAKRLSVYDDVTALFRQMIDEARREGAVTGEMRRRYLGEIDVARTRRSTTACTRPI